MTRSFRAVVLRIPSSREDELSGALGWSSHGVQIMPLSDGQSQLRVFIRRGDTDELALDQASAALRAAGIDPAECDLRAEVVDDERWVERYQALLQPFPIGSRYQVCPAAETPQPGPRRVLRLVPSRAFGTGEHPTTQLCVEALEQWVQPDSAWLDVGCGTGVLAMVCVHEGASRVLGLDSDAEALEVARETLLANRRYGPTQAIELVVGSIDDAPAGDWDGVVVNISAAFIREHAGAVVKRLGPGGVCLATGFLIEDLEDLIPRLEQAGLVIEESRHRAPWALVIGQRAV